MMVSQNKQNLTMYHLPAEFSRVIQGVTKLFLHNTAVLAIKPNFNWPPQVFLFFEGC